MSTEVEVWNEVGFETGMNTKDTPEQLMLAMMEPRGSLMMAARNGVHSCRREEGGNDKGWPSKSKKIDAEEVNGDKGADWINEEGKTDRCSGLNEEFSEMEEDLKKVEFDGMAGHGSAIVEDPSEIGNVELHPGDGRF